MKKITRSASICAFLAAFLTCAVTANAQGICRPKQINMSACGGEPTDSNYCPRDSGWPYTVSHYSNRFFYGANNPLKTTLTGGMWGPPLYPGYWSHKPSPNAADADKFSSTITVTFDRPIGNVRVIFSHFMNQSVTYQVTGMGGGSGSATLGPFAGGPDPNPAADVFLEGGNITGFTIQPTNFSSDGGWSFFLTGAIEFVPQELAAECICSCDCPAILPWSSRPQ